MKTTGIKVLLAILCPLVILGCGDKGDSPQKADTPRQALDNMRLALMARDKEAFADCFEASGKQGEMIDAFYEFSAVASKFDQAMNKAYGEDAVKQAMGGHSKGVPFQDESWLEDVTIQVDGNTATAVKQGESQPLRLAKKDGLWRINAESMLGEAKDQSDEDTERLIKMFQLMAGVVTDVSQTIGQPGYTAEKINQEMGKAMMMAMMQAAGSTALPTQ